MRSGSLRLRRAMKLAAAIAPSWLDQSLACCWGEWSIVEIMVIGSFGKGMMGWVVQVGWQVEMMEGTGEDE